VAKLIKLHTKFCTTCAADVIDVQYIDAGGHNPSHHLEEAALLFRSMLTIPTKNKEERACVEKLARACANDRISNPSAWSTPEKGIASVAVIGNRVTIEAGLEW